MYQNFTAVHLNQLLASYEDPEGTNELSLEFPWSLPQDLSSFPFPMQLIVSVYYLSADGRSAPYSSVLYNGTVFFVPKSEAFDYASVLPHALSLLAMGAFAWLSPAAFPETAALFTSKAGKGKGAEGGAGSSSGGSGNATPKAPVQDFDEVSCLAPGVKAAKKGGK